MFTIANVPTVGLYIGWVFGVIGFFLLVFGAVITYRSLGRNYRGDHETDFWFGLSLAGTGILTLIVTLLAMWPLRYEYHHYVSKTGTVEKISNRFIGDGNGGTNQRFVIKLTGDPAAYSVDDTRASLLTVGARVGIKCKKEHQFFQPYEQNGWACRWGA